jgi:hypothetical protein
MTARVVVNAVLRVSRAGIWWEYLPRDFPPFKAVHTEVIRDALRGPGAAGSLRGGRAATKRSSFRRCCLDTPRACGVSRQHGTKRDHPALRASRGRRRAAGTPRLAVQAAAQVVDPGPGRPPRRGRPARPRRSPTTWPRHPGIRRRRRSSRRGRIASDFAPTICSSISMAIAVADPWHDNQDM